MMDIPQGVQRLSREERGVPSEWVTVQGHEFAPDVAPRVEAMLRSANQVRVLAGHRDEKENADQHGLDRSYHRNGRAVDFAGDAKSLAELAGLASVDGASEVSMENPNGTQILHVAWAGGNYEPV